MNLRTRLSLAFTFLSLIPTGLLGWAALRTSERAFNTMARERLTEAEEAARNRIDDQGRELLRTAHALAEGSPAVRRAARDLYLGQAELPALVPLAESLQSGTDLSVLFLLDAEGRVISSGHLPAAFGNLQPGLLALAQDPDRSQARSGDPAAAFRIRTVDVRRDGRIEPVVTAVMGTSVEAFADGRPSLYIVVGKAIDDLLASSLRDVTGASIRLQAIDGKLLGQAAGPEATGPDGPVSRPASVLARLTGGEGVASHPLRIPVRDREGGGFDILLSIDITPLTEARGQILVVVVASGLLGLIAAVLLGGLLASRITRPLTALAQEAAALGRGDDDEAITIAASGEVGALVSAFETMRQEIRASRDRIAAAERVAAWQEIARQLAHEIKNPLTPISMAIETLRRAHQKGHPAFEEIFDESTGAILEEVSALRRIVDEFARFARLPAPQPQAITVRELIEGTTGLFPDPPDGIQIETELPEGSGLARPIEVDRDQIQQVLLNLVTNALQALATRASVEERGRIRITAMSRAESVVIRVSDDGPGISADDLPRIFTPYFTTKDTGTGLGLAICHRIATEHGGLLEVQSKPGAGATFTLTLPRARAI